MKLSSAASSKRVLSYIAFYNNIIEMRFRSNSWNSTPLTRVASAVVLTHWYIVIIIIIIWNVKSTISVFPYSGVESQQLYIETTHSYCSGISWRITASHDSFNRFYFIDLYIYNTVCENIQDDGFIKFKLYTSWRSQL